MEEASNNTDHPSAGEDAEVSKEKEIIELEENNSPQENKEFATPTVGMEFESYEDAYNYYICYAKEIGFCVRVKNSWFKRNSKEKYGAVLCCSSQGFKKVKDVNKLRKETRTGCPAMLRMRVSSSLRWRVVEVMHEHNHVLGTKVHKIKKVASGTKRKLASDNQTIKLYKALVIDNGENEEFPRNSLFILENNKDSDDKLNLKKGDSRAIYNYLVRMQLTNPNFFYLMDMNNEGRLRNVFWADARCRANAGYFGDVIYLDNTYLVNKFEIPLVAFVGLNHHGQKVLLACGLLADENKESYTWLLKSWLSCMLGRSPQTIVTQRCKLLEKAISENFPKAKHSFSLSCIVKKVPEKLGGLKNYDAIRKSFNRAVYETLKPLEFEASWGFMMKHFKISYHEWLSSLYEDRVKWAPVYVKDTFFAGLAANRPGETLNPFFDRYIHKQTPLKEFLDKYELALHKKYKEESIADIESRNSNPILKTKCPFELELSKSYTREMFNRFQSEVEEMYACFSTTKLHIDDANIIFLVKERVMREVKDYEVLYNRGAGEVRCICSCFNFNGYLCRHALSVLNFNGVEIPCKYVLARWRKDYKRLYVLDNGLENGDNTDQVQWFSQLYRSGLQVVEEGVLSLDHYKVALEAFGESLNRVHAIEEKHE